MTTGLVRALDDLSPLSKVYETKRPAQGGSNKILAFDLFKTGLELISVLGNYDHIKSLSSFKFFSITSSALQDYIYAGSSCSDLYDTVVNISKSLNLVRKGYLDFLFPVTFKHLPCALLTFKDFQGIFVKTVTHWKDLELPRPIALVSRVLQITIAPKALFAAKTSCSAVNALSYFFNNKRKLLASEIALMGYSYLSYRSTTPSWIKFGLLAMWAALRVVSRRENEPVSFDQWVRDRSWSLEELQEHIIDGIFEETYRMKISTRNSERPYLIFTDITRIADQFSQGHEKHLRLFCAKVADAAQKAIQKNIRALQNNKNHDQYYEIRGSLSKINWSAYEIEGNQA